MNRRSIARDFKRNKWLYALALPVVIYYVLFQYLPMYGAVIAFQNYTPMRGIWGSEWIGLEHFHSFFNSYYFWRLLGNTVLLSLYSLLFEFTAPIILALLIHEVRSRYIKSFVQTVSFMPYFISLIVVSSLIKDLTHSGGIVNLVYTWLTGGDGQDMLQQPGLFRGIYVLSEIWQRMGWESIIYAAALTTIPREQYEAARIDGASRFRQMISITLPGLLPTIMVMGILRMGRLLEVGYEKILLLYNPVIYETADVVSTFVYRKGLLDNDWSFSSAIGLFNSAINLLLLLSANALSRKINQNSLW
ncbi:ABC transporter permease [Paenibacillus silagei]|uniref:Aldouronate transport system permease protein n=1 Tax=Paenibacillus silagei TaxID=1670801 RepID=A0ABS4P0K6_9BACL|nr:ABC transporter permease subunit [Paenibacillus silagei]MBP2115822.1 putative aldouronate transport system permease protein [Paenibacillus silagei]